MSELLELLRADMTLAQALSIVENYQNMGIRAVLDIKNYAVFSEG